MKMCYCKKCSWRIEVDNNEAIGNKCSNCGNQGLSFVEGSEKEVADFFNIQDHSINTLCPCCGGTGFKTVMTYEGNKEFNTLSSTPKKCRVCHKHCDIDSLRIIKDGVRECKNFEITRNIQLEQDLESLAMWDCKCGHRNTVQPYEISYKCAKCGKGRKFNIKANDER